MTYSDHSSTEPKDHNEYDPGTQTQVTCDRYKSHVGWEYGIDQGYSGVWNYWKCKKCGHKWKTFCNN